MKNKESFKKRKISKNHILSILLVVAFILLAYNLANTLSFFNIDTVIIKGNTLLEDERVLLYSGVAVGENIFDLDKAEIEMNLKSESYIRDVDISRELPNRVIISVEEETDALVIDGDEKVYISSDGKVLDKSETLKGYFVPVLKGLELGENTVSKRLVYKNDIDKELFEEFTSGFSKLKLHDITNHVVIDKDNNIEINLSSGEIILLGNFEDISYKLDYLSTIVEDLEKKDKFFEKIDFTKGNRVIVEEKIFREED